MNSLSKYILFNHAYFQNPRRKAEWENCPSVAMKMLQKIFSTILFYPPLT